jgi:Ca-activated chloride channel family protein
MERELDGAARSVGGWWKGDGLRRPARGMALALAGLFVVLGTVPAIAQGQAQPAAENPDMSKTLAPYFLVKGGGEGQTESFPLRGTSAQVTIAGVIADVTVKQSYKNNGQTPIEATYVFPASTRAAVHGMRMTIGDRVVEAQIKEKQKARKEYEQAKSEGKTASLLEQHRPNVFQMNVANILPGDVVEVELRYTELIAPEEGVYELVFPTVVGPRYSNRPEAGSAPEQRWTKNPFLHKDAATPHAFDIAVTLAAATPVSEVVSPTHKVTTTFDGPQRATIRLDPQEKGGGNRDFILRYRLQGGQIETGLILEKGDQEHFFLLMVQPPRRVAPSQIAPREYIFLVDVSGSMNGFPINVSKQLLRSLLAGLRPTDLFNVVLFAGGSSQLSPTSVAADPANVQRAVHLIDTQQGGGGTELVPALKRALAIPANEGYARSLILTTDGYVDVEQEAFALVRDHLDQLNVFAFGIGSSVNRFLIEGLARVGQGEPFIATDEEEAARVAERFRRIASAPLLVDPQLQFEGLDVYDVEPARLPDVFAERPLVVFGKWRGEPRGSVTVTGRAGSTPWTHTIDVGRQAVTSTGQGLKYLWARHKIALLSDLNEIASNEETVRAVTELGLSYSLLTKYTSFIAVDHVVRRTEGDLQTVRQPLPLPQGVSNLAVGGQVSSAPEPETWALIFVALGVLGWITVKQLLA